MSAAEQLRPDVGAEKCSASDKFDLVDAVIFACDGNACEAVHELMLDADFLRDQLHMASMVMSHGYGPGWKPKYERVS